jgi:hypothetical protein
LFGAFLLKLIFELPDQLALILDNFSLDGGDGGAASGFFLFDPFFLLGICDDRTDESAGEGASSCSDGGAIPAPCHRTDAGSRGGTADHTDACAGRDTASCSDAFAFGG